MEDYHPGKTERLPKDIPPQYKREIPQMLGVGKRGDNARAPPATPTPDKEQTEPKHINAFTTQTRSPRLTLVE
ncbi:hypothetical protein TNIN_119371 [Trichonephila inaurata madagascariensis]|uniref:Uncharacterized protein n=1 Tax=Trichonephila inaurata madagascariensis TaxID=2747483 RepID=A0A8X7C5B2_9ARAC|nr:hypothetical protein TNIN_119371 [Trichonephila inaurata madagascariensis]